MALAIFIPYTQENIKKSIKLSLIILIGTPMLGGEIAAIFTRYGVNVLDILVISLFSRGLIYYVKNNIKIKFNITDFFISIFLLLNVIAFIKGIISNGQYAIEFKNIIVIVILYSLLKITDFKINIKNLCEIIFNSVAIYSLIILFIIMLGQSDKYGLIDFEKRLAVNVTLYIFTIPYGIYDILKYKKNIILKLLEVLILLYETYILYLNQNRTIIILSLTAIVIIFFMTFFDGNRNGYIKVIFNILFVLISILIIYILINYMGKYMDPLIERFLDIINKTGSYGNYVVRANTQNYYLSIIVHSLIGVGWGSQMLLFPKGGGIITTNGAIDNFFITLGYKVGLLALLIFIIIIIINYINVIMISFRYGKIYKLFLVFVPFLLFGTSYITSQSFHTMTTACVTWIIIYYFSSTKKIDEIEGDLSNEQ